MLSFKERGPVMPTGLICKNSIFQKIKVQKIMSLFLFFIFCVLSTILATEGKCSQVTLAWDRNKEPNIVGYKIYYGTGSRVYNWFIDVGNVTKYTVTGLADGSTYYFAATAYDASDKESTYSSEVSHNGCTYSISPITSQFAQQGGTKAVQVSTQTGCSWTASSGASWLAITAGSKGTGSGTVSYSVASNSSNNKRTVAFTIARSIFTVNQAGGTQEYIVKITKQHNNEGDGVVKSYDGKINCGEVCSNSYKQDSVVTFSATPNKGSAFAGWLPASLDCAGTGSCKVPIDNAKNVKAVFVGDLELNIVNISKDGGKGRVTSSPWSLDCKTDNTGTCEAMYRYNREITLSAYPSSGSTFVGWRPAKLCPGTGTCVVTMDRKRKVKALFSKPSEE
jgi:hypothetical protein